MVQNCIKSLPCATQHCGPCQQRAAVHLLPCQACPPNASSFHPQILEDFPKVDDIHPFYADLLNVLYDRDHYKLALGQLNTARNLIDRVSQGELHDSSVGCLQQAHRVQGRSLCHSGLHGVAAMQGVALCAARKACLVSLTALQLTWCPCCRLCADAQVRRLAVPVQGVETGRPGEPFLLLEEAQREPSWIRVAFLGLCHALTVWGGPWVSMPGHQGIPLAPGRFPWESSQPFWCTGGSWMCLLCTS